MSIHLIDTLAKAAQISNLMYISFIWDAPYHKFLHHMVKWKIADTLHLTRSMQKGLWTEGFRMSYISRWLWIMNGYWSGIAAETVGKMENISMRFVLLERTLL